jgi:hypothetical protein
MYQVLLRKFRTLKSEIETRGWLRVGRITLDRAAIFLLARVFDFPPSWHPPLSARPYRRTVAGIINTLEPHTVCEVGCGLGSILVLVKATQRCGYDADAGVIRAARLIRSGRIRFRQGSIADISESGIDVLVLVNWIHEVSPGELAAQLWPQLPRTKYLLLDAIDPDNDFGYRFKHDFAFLAGRAERISTTRHPGEGRSFQLFRVTA